MSTAWTRVRSPNVGPTATTLRGVASITADAVWSVGSWTDETGGERSLTQLWDGKGWQVIDSPSPRGQFNVLWGVAGAVPTSVWAVGYSAKDTDDPDQAQLLMLRGDGQSWSVEDVPAPGPVSALAAIDMVDDGDGWAVGTYRRADSAVPRGLILHWTAGAWVHVEAPDFGDHAVRLTGVSAAGARDVWAVGYRADGPGQEDHVILHWDGRAWRTVSGPAIEPATRTALFAVAAVSADEAWAVGYSHPAGIADEQALQAFGIRWTGAEWVRVANPTPLPSPDPTPLPNPKPLPSPNPTPSPAPGPGPTKGLTPGAAIGEGIQLRGVVVHNGVWVAGYRVDAGGEHEVVMFFDGVKFQTDTLPLPGPPPDAPQNVTGTALSAITASPLTGELWTVGWVSAPRSVGHGTNVLTRQVLGAPK